MADWVVAINGYRDTELGLDVVVQAPRPWSPAAETRGRSTGPGLLGAVASLRATGDARTTTLSVRLRADVEDRQAAVDRLLDLLRGRFEVEWSDQPGRVRYCRTEEVEVQAEFEAVAWVEGDLVATVPLIEDDPVAWDREATVLAIGNTPVPLPLGTAVSTPVLRFPGEWSALDIQYRNHRGVLLSTLTFVAGPPQMPASDYLEVDCGTQGEVVVVRGTAGVRATAAGWSLYVPSGSFFRLDPGDGDYRRERWPTVSSSSPGVIEYVRAWR